MPIKSPPTTWHCPKCQWRKTVSPKSDALQAGVEWFDHCPQCGCREIESREATALERIAASLKL